MCEPRAEPNLFELCRGEAINRIISNLCASREQSQTCLSYAEAMPEIGHANSNLANRNKYEIPIHCQLRLYEGLPGTESAHTGLSEGAFRDGDNPLLCREIQSAAV